MYLLVVKYIYYRHKSQTPDMENPEEVIEKYCKYIYANDETQRIRTQVRGKVLAKITFFYSREW